jgi:integrase/recombinase XerD
MPEQIRTQSGSKRTGGGYRYVREPLRGEEADLLSNACRTSQEKLIVCTLLDTGLRVSELCGMTAENIQWQQRQIRVQGKGGPYGKKTKMRTVPMSLRVRTLLEPWFALNDRFPVGPRRVQKIVKEIANRAKISREVTPHVLRHTFATLALQKGDVSPNPRKFREAPFCVFFAKTFHNWPEKREVFDVNHGQVRVGWTQIRLSKAS